MFSKATIRLAGGRRFVIEAPASSELALYVQGARLDGKPFQQAWLRHADIMRGAGGGAGPARRRVLGRIRRAVLHRCRRLEPAGPPDRALRAIDRRHMVWLSGDEWGGGQMGMPAPQRDTPWQQLVRGPAQAGRARLAALARSFSFANCEEHRAIAAPFADAALTGRATAQ